MDVLFDLESDKWNGRIMPDDLQKFAGTLLQFLTNKQFTLITNDELEVPGVSIVTKLWLSPDVEFPVNTFLSEDHKRSCLEINHTRGIIYIYVPINGGKGPLAEYYNDPKLQNRTLRVIHWKDNGSQTHHAFVVSERESEGD